MTPPPRIIGLNSSLLQNVLALLLDVPAVALMGAEARTLMGRVGDHLRGNATYAGGLKVPARLILRAAWFCPSNSFSESIRTMLNYMENAGLLTEHAPDDLELRLDIVSCTTSERENILDTVDALCPHPRHDLSWEEHPVTGGYAPYCESCDAYPVRNRPEPRIVCPPRRPCDHAGWIMRTHPDTGDLMPYCPACGDYVAI